MTYSLINKCAKNYYNRTFIVQVIAKNVVTCFFLRHSVVPAMCYRAKAGRGSSSVVSETSVCCCIGFPSVVGDSSAEQLAANWSPDLSEFCSILHTSWHTVFMKCHNAAHWFSIVSKCWFRLVLISRWVNYLSM